MKMNWTALGSGCLWLAGATLAVLPASAQIASQAPASATPPRASISEVAVAQSGPQTTVRVSGTGELHFRASRLDSPPRLVLDFAQTGLNVRKYKVPSPYAPVQDVRLGQPAPGQSRVVIDLASFAPFTTQEDASCVTVLFTTPTVPDASPEAPLATPAASHSALKAAKRKTASVSEPNMPLPSWLTGQDMGFARPAEEPAARGQADLLVDDAP